jgi:ankyrin repeat protein
MLKARIRNLKRLWEIGATAALLLAVAVAVGGFFAWRERQARQRRLDRELAGLLANDTASRADCVRMRSLLREGASVRVRDSGGWSVVMEAVGARDLVLLREALARGADVNTATAEGLTPLYLATWCKNSAAVRLLLEQGADVRPKHPTVGQTALWVATQNHDQAIIRLLKQHGAQVER